MRIEPAPEPMESDISDHPGDAAEVKRNARLFILNGGLSESGYRFASSETVIPAFIQTLTGSSVMVGLSRALMRVGWAWPQVFISHFIEERPRKLPFLVGVQLIRGAFTVGIGIVLWSAAGVDATSLFVVFLAMYAVTTSMMGATNVPRMDVVGKIVPSRQRARVFAMTRLVGGGLAIGTGGVISYVLSEKSGFGFPGSYGVLFMIGGAVTGASALIFALIREPIEENRRKREPFRAYLMSGLRLLKDDANYRRLFALRYTWAAAEVGRSFYVPYAISNLGIAAVFVGLFVSVSQASSLLSNALWAWVAPRRGSRSLLVYGAYLLALSVSIPILTPYLPVEYVRPLTLIGIESAIRIDVLFFTLTFVFDAFASSSNYTGRTALVLDIAPPDRRPTYTSFMNTFGVLQGAFPILAGLAATVIGYRGVFLISLCCVPFSVILVHRFKEIESSGSGE